MKRQGENPANVSRGGHLLWRTPAGDLAAVTCTTPGSPSSVRADLRAVRKALAGS